MSACLLASSHENKTSSNQLSANTHSTTGLFFYLYSYFCMGEIRSLRRSVFLTQNKAVSELPWTEHEMGAVCV